MSPRVFFFLGNLLIILDLSRKFNLEFLQIFLLEMREFLQEYFRKFLQEFLWNSSTSFYRSSLNKSSNNFLNLQLYKKKSHRSFLWCPSYNSFQDSVLPGVTGKKLLKTTLTSQIALNLHQKQERKWGNSSKRILKNCFSFFFFFEEIALEIPYKVPTEVLWGTPPAAL